MNKYQDALNRCESDFEDRIENDNILMTGRIDIEILQELVDLATPKSVTKTCLDFIGDVFGGKCECGRVVYEYHTYCPDCGQKIDWEMNNENN